MGLVTPFHCLDKTTSFFLFRLCRYVSHLVSIRIHDKKMPPRTTSNNNKKRKRDDFIHNKSKNKEDVSFEYIKKQITKNVGKGIRILVSIDHSRDDNKTVVEELSKYRKQAKTCACCGEMNHSPVLAVVEGHDSLEPSRDHGQLVIHLKEDLQIPLVSTARDLSSEIRIHRGVYEFGYFELKKSRCAGLFLGGSESGRTDSLLIDFEREYYTCEFARCLSATELNVPFPLEIVCLCLSFLSSPFE
jgi:hypothetical protein